MEPSQADQPQPDQSASQPKKQRMTYAEWRKANPNHTILSDREKEVAEITEGIMKLVAQWYRDSQAAARRKARQFNKPAPEKKATPKSSTPRRKSKHR